MSAKFNWAKPNVKKKKDAHSPSISTTHARLLRKAINNRNFEAHPSANTINKYYSLDKSKIEFPSLVRCIHFKNDHILIECKPRYDIKNDINLIEIYKVFVEKIPNEDKNNECNSGDIVKFKNFGTALVLWKNALCQLCLMVESKNVIVHKVKGFYVKFDGIGLSHSNPEAILRKKIVEDKRDSPGTVCHICMKKFYECTKYETNIKSKSKTFNVCIACLEIISKQAGRCSVVDVLEKLYLIHINKKIPMKTALANFRNSDNQSNRKLERDQQAAIHRIMEKEKLDFGFARNVYFNKYSIEVAKERQRLKDRENSGKSVDIYCTGRRRSGSFH